MNVLLKKRKDRAKPKQLRLCFRLRLLRINRIGVLPGLWGMSRIFWYMTNAIRLPK